MTGWRGWPWPARSRPPVHAAARPNAPRPPSYEKRRDSHDRDDHGDLPQVAEQQGVSRGRHHRAVPVRAGRHYRADARLIHAHRAARPGEPERHRLDPAGRAGGVRGAQARAGDAAGAVRAARSAADSKGRGGRALAGGPAMTTWEVQQPAVTAGGDVGGDYQAGEAWSVRLASPEVYGALITVYVFAEALTVNHGHGDER